MATLVAEAVSQSRSEQICNAPQSESTAQPHESTFSIFLVSALTLFAVAINGYHPYAEDGGLYLAGILRLLDPALYPHCTVFVLEPMRHSLFAPTVAGIVRWSHLSLPIVLLALYLASIWTTLFAAWMLASRCWYSRSARAGSVVLLACWLALPIAGTALLFMDPYATARSFSTPCMVLALVGTLDLTERGSPHRLISIRRGFLLWAISIALAAVMHPLMAAYALGATLMLYAVRFHNRILRLYAASALAAAAMALAVCLNAIARPESADYLRIALTRTYWFLVQWHWYELAGLAAPLGILTISISNKLAPATRIPCLSDMGARQTLTRMAVAVGATSCLIALFFARTASTTQIIARLQPLRAFQIVYLILILTLGAQLGERLLRLIALRWAATMILLGGIMFYTALNAFPNSNHLEIPGLTPHNQWIKAFLWIRDNTPTDALFALDADYINAPGEDAQCFRAIAQRSALADYSKDGGEASIAPELTVDWIRSQQAQHHLSAPSTTDSDRISALQPLGVSWVVLESAATTRFDCPYSNSAVKVCLLR